MKMKLCLSRTSLILDSVWWIVVLLLFVNQFRFYRTESWNSDDEQNKITSTGRSFYKYVQKKLPNNDAGTKSSSEGSDSGGGSSTLESLEEYVDPDDNEFGRSNSYSAKLTKSTVRQTMDNIVRDMRAKAMNKVYQSIETQQPQTEQSLSNSYDDDDSSGGITGLVEQPSSSGKGNIRIAVQSKRRYEFIPVHFDRDDIKNPRMIEIVSDTMPLRLHFKSQSAAIVVTQSHMSPPMKPIDETVTMDQPYRMSHEVHKPIIQEVKEIIQPYRNIVQQLKPVIEDIKTIVPKDSDVDHQHSRQQPPANNNNYKRSNENAAEWSPMPSLNRRPNLRPPLPRPGSPANQIQSKYSPNNRIQQQPIQEGVKTSESRPKIQRRMHRNVESTFGNPSNNNNNHFNNNNNNNNNRYQHQPKRDKYQQQQHQRQRHLQSFSNQMQFGASSPELVYHPMFNNDNNQYISNNNDREDSGTLNDYFMPKDKYRPNMSKFEFNSGGDDNIEFGGTESESVRHNHRVLPDHHRHKDHDSRHHYEDYPHHPHHHDTFGDHSSFDADHFDGDEHGENKVHSLESEDDSAEDNQDVQSSTIGEAMSMSLKSRGDSFSGSMCPFGDCPSIDHQGNVEWPLHHLHHDHHGHSHYHHHHHHDHHPNHRHHF